MSGRVLLDTCIIIDLLAGKASVRASLRQADEVFLSSIALGELYFGARRSGRVDHNLAQIEEFLQGCSVLSCDAGTAREYGTIKIRLKARGQPIPENDVWIASIACQHSLTLITKDSHFQEVDGLKIDTW